MDRILKKLKIDLNKEKFSMEDIKKGVTVELEHGKKHKKTNVTNDNLEMTVKIALAHLYEFPDYYKRLEKLEKEAEKYWKVKLKKY